MEGTMKRPTLTAAALLAGALIALPAAAAQAATTICTTELSSQTINGNVEVPSGTACVLNGVQVNGNVKIDPGAAFALGYRDSTRRNTITGSILGTNIQSFDTDVPGSTIDGSIDIDGISTVPFKSLLASFGLPDLDSDGASFFTGLDVHGATVIKHSGPDARWDDFAVTSDLRGGFIYTDNAATLAFLNGGTVGAAVHLGGNTGGGDFDGYNITGTLACGNTPAITVTGTTATGFNQSSGGLC
jgi:hypothetical protein